MRIDPVERLNYWKSREALAVESVVSWQKSGDAMSPGAVKRASDWLKTVRQLIQGWQTAADSQLARRQQAA